MSQRGRLVAMAAACGVPPALTIALDDRRLGLLVRICAAPDDAIDRLAARWLGGYNEQATHDTRREHGQPQDQ